MNKSPLRPNHQQRFGELGNPFFIFSLCLLCLNDWVLKVAFHNWITGKLSDFAGLFAFSFFIGVIFPRYRIINHFFIALVFIFWKSPGSQPLIDAMNNLGIPVGRTIDFSDHFALITVYLSYISLQRVSYIQLRPIALQLLVAFSVISFVATSLPPGDEKKYVNINKKYVFPFAKRELVSRLNAIQLKEINALRNYGATINFDSETNVFSFDNTKDTLAILLDYKKIGDDDTIKLKTAFAEIMVLGDDQQSVLQLNTVYKFTPKLQSRDYRSLAIKQFEKRIVKKINNYRYVKGFMQ